MVTWWGGEVVRVGGLGGVGWWGGGVVVVVGVWWGGVGWGWGWWVRCGRVVGGGWWGVGAVVPASPNVKAWKYEVMNISGLEI